MVHFCTIYILRLWCTNQIYRSSYIDARELPFPPRVSQALDFSLHAVCCTRRAFLLCYHTSALELGYQVTIYNVKSVSLSFFFFIYIIYYYVVVDGHIYVMSLLARVICIPIYSYTEYQKNFPKPLNTRIKSTRTQASYSVLSMLTV